MSDKHSLKVKEYIADCLNYAGDESSLDLESKKTVIGVDMASGDDKTVEACFKGGHADIGNFSHLKFESKSETLDASLDELSELSEHWKRNRERGITPKHLKNAIVQLAGYIVALDELGGDS